MSQPVLECNNPWETACNCGTRYAPCWPRPDTSCCDRLEPVNPTPEQTTRIERMLHVATEIMWRLSGKQFGSCPVTMRPCRQTCSGGTAYGYWSGSTWTPVLDGGRWYNEKCGKCAPSGCSCTEVCEVVLPGPISEVLEVKVDGVVLDPSEYRLDNARKLVRQFGIEPDGGFIRLFTSAQTGYDPLNQWCDLTPPPDGSTGSGPVEPGGCYPSALNNPSWFWTDETSVTATYSADSPNATIASLTDPAGGFYDFSNIPANTVISPGTTVTSLLGPDGQFARFTVISGGVSKYFNTNYGFVIEPGAVIRMEKLIRTDACWPTCQELGLPDTEPGTFSARVRPGAPVPQGGLWAAGLLACQLLAACDEGAECALPANAQRIARQGVTVELTPVFVDREAGGFNTGIAAVDLWLESVNPYKAKMPSRVFSVDRPAPRVQTWPC